MTQTRVPSLAIAAKTLWHQSAAEWKSYLNICEQKESQLKKDFVMESYYKPNPRWPGVPHHTQADLVFHFQGTLPQAAADTRGGAAHSQLSSSQPLSASCAMAEQS